MSSRIVRAVGGLSIIGALAIIVDCLERAHHFSEASLSWQLLLFVWVLICVGLAVAGAGLVCLAHWARERAIWAGSLGLAHSLVMLVLPTPDSTTYVLQRSMGVAWFASMIVWNLLIHWILRRGIWAKVQATSPHEKLSAMPRTGAASLILAGAGCLSFLFSVFVQITMEGLLKHLVYDSKTFGVLLSVVFLGSAVFPLAGIVFGGIAWGKTSERNVGQVGIALNLVFFTLLLFQMFVGLSHL